MKTLLRLLLIYALVSLAVLELHAETKPNVIVILADDLGWRDLGVLGATDLKTPNLDALARGGVRCVNGYVTAPVCSPSRAALMTGRYQQRFGHETNPGGTLERHPVFGLPVTETTIGNRMKDLGYATGWIGKSHLGGVTNLYHPLLRGFDEFFGFIESHHNYFETNNYSQCPTNCFAGQEDPILRGFQPVRETNYLTLAFARECTNFIARHAGTPFFLYAPFNATHFPLQAPPALLGRFSTNNFTGNLNRYTNAAMLAGLDDAVSNIVSTLRALNIESNTLIFFTSDNGGATNLGSVNLPLRGSKTDIYEGGIRVPFLMRWPAGLPTNHVLNAPVSTLDILPAAVAAAGGTVPAAWQLDGVNLLPYIATNGVPHPRLFWRVETDGINPPNEDDVKDGLRAVREGNWKLVKPSIEETWELYDLATDPGELNNVAPSHPDVVQRLVAAFDDWNAQLARPNYARNKTRFATPEFVREDIPLGTNVFFPGVPPVFPPSTQLVTDEVSVRTNVWPFFAPEFNNELCFAAIVDRTAIAIYRDLRDNPNGWFRRVATLTLPPDTNQRFLYSLRPLAGQRGFNGVSYFTCAAFENDDPLNPGDSGIWLFGLGPSTNNALVRRLDEGATSTNRFAGRSEPGAVIGEREVLCYYTSNDGVSGAQYRLAKTGLKRPDYFAPATGFTSLQFARSFTNGTFDLAGRFMGGTEVRQMVTHDGKLFAGTGVRRFDPYPDTTNSIPTNWTGAQILIKDSPTTDWRVDPLSPPIFLAHLQVDALESVNFTRDVGGTVFDPPANLLVAGLTDLDISTNGATIASVRTRLPGGWGHSTVATSTAPANVISFGSHAVTGGHFLFAGLENGEIYRGVLNTNAPGLLSWFSNARELSGGGPVTSFAECSRRLYAVSGLKQVNSNAPVTGGLFVRVDTNNTWQRVYQWNASADLPAAPESQRLALGLTSAPSPDGASNGVLLLCRAWPGVIERINPNDDHAVTVELDVRDFFARRWNDNRIRSNDVTIGYTGFTAATNPVTGETVGLVGLWLEHPDTNAFSYHGTHFLIRHADGTYEAADVANDFASGSLRATRCLAVSPFAQDKGRAVYLGGYDTGDDSSTNTAWMLRGDWAAWPTIALSRPNPPDWQLAWPIAGTNWILENTTAMEPIASWQPVSERSTRSLTNQTVSVPAKTNASYFRLRRP